MVLWFDVDGPIAPFERERFPAFIWELPGKPQSVYGFPAIDGPRGGVKVATESYAHTTTPDAVARDVTPEEIAAVHADYVAPFFPAISPRCLRATTCLYTVTPDFGFVVDRHPRLPQRDRRLAVLGPRVQALGRAGGSARRHGDRPRVSVRSRRLRVGALRLTL